MSSKQEEKQESNDVIFRQFFDRTSCTYTYLLGCTSTKDCLLIDPVLELVDRDLQFVKELGLNLKYTLNTHCHADHITGSGTIKTKHKDVKSVIGPYDDVKADIKVKQGDEIKCGTICLKVRKNRIFFLSINIEYSYLTMSFFLFYLGIGNSRTYSIMYIICIK